MIEPLATSTRPAKVLTDQGIGFLKGLGNPMGDGALAEELVGTELARWIGLRTPPFAVLNVRDIEIPMLGRGYVQDGPAFVSCEIKGTTSDGGTAFLRKLTNPEDVAKLVLFDTWIRNSDRHAPWLGGQAQGSNLDNLFFRPNGRKFDLVAFDHSHCFVETTLDPELSWQGTTTDDRIYGNFPSFKPYLTYDRLDAARRRLREMNQETANEIVRSVPAEWGVSTETRAKWAEVICARAARVDQFIELGLMGQTRMEFER